MSTSLRLLAAHTARRGSRPFSALSFASPESDFASAAMPTPNSINAKVVWSNQLSFASAESDFCDSSSNNSQVKALSPFAVRRPERVWSNTLSFATPESDCSTSSPTATEAALVLPTTFQEALLEEDHAIVVTTAQAPHRIVHVNAAWEDLCGFPKNQVLDETLQVIQGPDSNARLASQTVRNVLETKETHDAYLVNYTASGEKFINHLSMGPLYLDEDMPFLVGVLQKVSAHEVPCRMVAVE